MKMATLRRTLTHKGRARIPIMWELDERELLALASKYQCVLDIRLAMQLGMQGFFLSFECFGQESANEPI